MYNEVIIIGYSGNSYVVIDAIFNAGGTIKGYCDIAKKEHNPYILDYLGQESIQSLTDHKWIVGIGDNALRKKICEHYSKVEGLITVIHSKSYIGSGVHLKKGVFIAANVSINPFAKIGKGSIINTGSIVEHECAIGDYCHIAPGAVLAGNVTIMDGSFIGANATVKQGVTIGSNVIVGAGAVIINDIPDGKTVVGNPGRVVR